MDRSSALPSSPSSEKQASSAKGKKWCCGAAELGINRNKYITLIEVQHTMTVNRWLKILIPIQFFSLLIQPVTGFGYAITDHDFLEIIHITNGIIFLTLIAIHITLNRKWIKGSYFRRGGQR